MTVRGTILIFLFCLVGSGGTAHAARFDTQGLTDCGTAIAVEVIGGARFRTEAGEVVKLALVKAPEFWKQGEPYKSWPHASEAREALWSSLKGQSLTLYCEGKKTNRLQEIVAHVVMPDGRYLQYELVLQGHIFVFPRPTRRRGLESLFEAEGRARTNRAGLWTYDNLKPVDADGAGVRPGWFQIVRGKVLAAEKVRNTVYLNFGQNWRTDFTVEIPSIALRHFTKAGLDPLSWEKREVEVRGWIDYKAGPRLLLQGPGQLRLYE